ncbi:hypothetical protein Q31b_35010 [Novipirellula aureliae]|uniref:Uncharacterized protein n=1 Tax=Novipirellula aureliae TaxID=2527966 RepID=A0A5C6DYM5_9BACT|nr:hypothetical protein [Novipirellula aureliae]TWU40156.1 hypothetical protein Q31b_35010 [Novipirellula aureliae]
MIALKNKKPNRSRRRQRRARPRLRFTPYAWAKLLCLRDAGPSEVGGFGISDAKKSNGNLRLKLQKPARSPLATLLRLPSTPMGKHPQAATANRVFAKRPRPKSERFTRSHRKRMSIWQAS